MHTFRRYDDASPFDRTRAFADICDWLGSDRVGVIINYVESFPEITREQFRVMMSFCGVDGYPVERLADELGVAK